MSEEIKMKHTAVPLEEVFNMFPKEGTVIIKTAEGAMFQVPFHITPPKDDLIKVAE